MTIAGTYETVSSADYDKYLEGLGVGLIKRKLANTTWPTMIYIDNGNGKWTQKTQSKIKDSEITFTLGQEFEETLADDRKSKSVITLEGNTLTHKLNIEDSKYTSDIIRVFSDTEMKTTFNAGGKTGTRGFKKVA